jgi:hypothetical protein
VDFQGVSIGGAGMGLPANPSYLLDVAGTGSFTGDIRCGGGLYVGSTGTNPATGTITTTDYICALGGLHVGGTSDPGTDTLIVDLDARIGGGLYVGRTNYNPANDNIYYDGILQSYKGSTFYAVYAFHPLTTPLTHSAFYGDSFSTVSTSTIIQNTGWSSTIPANAKALLLAVDARDSAALGAVGLYFIVGPNSSYDYALQTRPIGGDVWVSNTGVVPCTNGDIYYRISASGASTLDIYMRCFGYWI